MSISTRTAFRRAVVATALFGSGVAAAETGNGAFTTASHDAMGRMMTGMSVATTGDVDHDFVALMTPHHQAAIEMAIAELRYGREESLKRIAQEIVVDQQQEIAAMQLALGQPLPPSIAAPTQVK